MSERNNKLCDQKGQDSKRVRMAKKTTVVGNSFFGDRPMALELERDGALTSSSRLRFPSLDSVNQQKVETLSF